MAEHHAEDYTRTENSGTHSINDQFAISHWLWHTDIHPIHEGLPWRDIKDRLDINLEYDITTSLGHLVEAGMVEGYQRPGPDGYAIAEWREDSIVNGEVEEAPNEGLDAVIEHMHDEHPEHEDGKSVFASGSETTVRNTLASRFDLKPKAVEKFLQSGDPVDKLNKAVDAIEEAAGPEPRESYGKIIFRNPANLYRLTEFAVELYEQEEDNDFW